MYFHNLIGTGSYTTSTTNMFHKRICSVPVGERIPQIPIDFRHHDGCFLFVFFVFFARVFLPSLFAATFPSTRAVVVGVVGVVLLAAIPFLLLLLLACLDAVQCREQILDRFFKIMLRVPEQSSTSKQSVSMDQSGVFNNKIQTNVFWY